MHHFPHLQQQLTEASFSTPEIEKNTMMINLHVLQKNNFFTFSKVSTGAAILFNICNLHRHILSQQSNVALVTMQHGWQAPFQDG